MKSRMYVQANCKNTLQIIYNRYDRRTRKLHLHDTATRVNNDTLFRIYWAVRKAETATLYVAGRQKSHRPAERWLTVVGSGVLFNGYCIRGLLRTDAVSAFWGHVVDFNNLNNSRSMNASGWIVQSLVTSWSKHRCKNALIGRLNDDFCW